jgi:uncharacterized protein DUF6879
MGEFERLFASMFTSFRRTAFRFEVRERYNVPLEEAPLRRFLAGEPADLRWLAEWHRDVATAAAAGRRYRRVRAVSVPFSDYTRFGLAMAESNIAAGEDIRYLDRRQYEELGLPGYDAWLFDDARLAVLHFDAADRMLGGEIVTDRAVVRRHCAWRDLAWRHAIARDEFVGGHLIRGPARRRGPG